MRQSGIAGAILALLDVSYEQSVNEIIAHCKATCEMPEREVTCKDVTDAIEALVKERWLIHSMKRSESHYRRRSQAQWDALKAGEQPGQGVLL